MKGSPSLVTYYGKGRGCSAQLQTNLIETLLYQRTQLGKKHRRPARDLKLTTNQLGIRATLTKNQRLKIKPGASGDASQRSTSESTARARCPSMCQRTPKPKPKPQVRLHFVQPPHLDNVAGYVVLAQISGAESWATWATWVRFLGKGETNHVQLQHPTPASRSSFTRLGVAYCHSN